MSAAGPDTDPLERWRDREGAPNMPRPVHYGTGKPGPPPPDPEDARYTGSGRATRQTTGAMDLQTMYDPVVEDLGETFEFENPREEIGITFHPQTKWETTPEAHVEGVERPDPLTGGTRPRTEHMILQPTRYGVNASRHAEWAPSGTWGERPASEGEPSELHESHGILRVVTSPWADHPGWEDVYDPGDRKVMRPSEFPTPGDDPMAPINIPVIAQRQFSPAYSRPRGRVGDTVGPIGGVREEDESEEMYEIMEGADSYFYKFLATPEMDIGRPVREGEDSADFTPGHRLALPSLLVQIQHSRPPGAMPYPTVRPPMYSEAIDATTGNAHVSATVATPEEGWPAGRPTNHPQGIDTVQGQYGQLSGGGHLSTHQFPSDVPFLDRSIYAPGERHIRTSRLEESRGGVPGAPVNVNKRDIEFAPDMVRFAHGIWQRQQEDWINIMRQGRE
jgi:hypothetical protein